MTYCVGLVLNEGLVLAADSRTNAGVDYVTTFSKLHVFTPAADRIFILLSAGNLGTTQEVLNRIRRDLDQASEQGMPGGAPGSQAYPASAGGNLLKPRYLFEAAEYVGRISLAVQREHGPALNQAGVSAGTTFILGGQIAGQPHGLMLIYPQGNYFAASPETPYLQIGENKYGKPAVDRIAKPELSLADGARLCFVSLDATSRSNATVGPPFEVAIYPKDTLALSHHLKLDADSEELKAMSRAWNQGICRAFEGLPRFAWEGPAKTAPSGPCG
jgi:putative proteasome-type protease